MTELLHPEDALSALLDGELSAAEAAVVRAHVVSCADCSAELDAVREARAALRSLPAIEPPAGFFESLLADGLPEPASRAQPARVVPMRSAMASAAAAVAAGLLLVVGFGGHDASAVSPEVSGAVERHAATLSAVSASLGGPNPIVAPGEVTPTTAPRRSPDHLHRPFTAPKELAGYQLTQAFESPEGVQLLYEKDGYGLSVFEQRGALNAEELAQGTRIKVGDDDGWRWEGGTADGRVIVVERGDLVFTVVGDESAAAVLAAAEDLPGSPEAGFTTRFHRACGDALDALSPAG